jgi:hypothetical protein
MVETPYHRSGEKFSIGRKVFGKREKIAACPDEIRHSIFQVVFPAIALEPGSAGGDMASNKPGGLAVPVPNN